MIKGFLQPASLLRDCEKVKFSQLNGPIGSKWNAIGLGGRFTLNAMEAQPRMELA
jgi:hypothetical protein